MSDDNTPPDGAGDDVNTSLLGDNPPGADAPPDGDKPVDGDTPPDGDKPEFKLDDKGEQILDDDGKPIPVDQPIEYTDFNMPEGVEVDEVFLGSATNVLKELGLNQEQAQKVVDLYAGKVAEQTTSINDQIKEWQNEARSNKEYGGESFDANVALARKALDEFADESTIKMLNDTGIGNHPGLIGMLVKFGKAIAEDSPGLGQAGADKKERTTILYPDAKT